MCYTYRMSYQYKNFYNKNAEFYNTRPTAKKLLIVGNKILTYGFAVAYLGLWLYGIILGSFTVQDYAKIFFVPLLTLVVVSVMRLAVSRPRPYSPQGAAISPLTTPSKKADDSFPSRHLACAAAIAVTILCYSYLFGSFALTLCGVLAYMRFALGLHYPSDLFVGVGVGTTIGALIFIL